MNPPIADPPVKALVNLVGLDGNAFVIIGTVQNALRKACRDAGFDREKTDAVLAQFRAESMSGDYDNVLRAAIRWTESPDDDAALARIRVPFVPDRYRTDTGHEDDE